MNKKVACIVVTYNRKDLLIKCLDAVNAQVYKPHTVFIIDNASTDGTREYVREKGYDSSIVDNIRFEYVQLEENIGGSGGFYTGFKTAYESVENFDAFWVMDDDGIADKNQLKELVSYLSEYEYICPIVKAIDNPNDYSFDPPSDKLNRDKSGNYIGSATPFNGILYSRTLVSKVGFPDKDMFIWGDDNNYHARCVKAGFTPIMLINAIHLHPRDRQIRVSSWFGRKIALPKENWKLYCYARNRVYNSYIINGRIKSIARCLVDFMDFLFALLKSNQINRLPIVWTAQKDGLKGKILVNRKFV